MVDLDASDASMSKSLAGISSVMGNGEDRWDGGSNASGG